MKRTGKISPAIYILTALLFSGCAQKVPEKQEITVISISQTEITDTTDTTGSSAAEQTAGSSSLPTETSVSSSYEVIELGTTAQTEETIPDWVTAEIQTEETEKQTKNEKQYDIDLTELNSTMLYAQVCNMIYEPTDYIGKSVKIRAPFTVAEEDGNTYYALLIYDSTACCMQGIEFDLGDRYSYPEDYPEIGEEITIGGIFGSYQEGIATYYKLYGAVRLD